MWRYPSCSSHLVGAKNEPFAWYHQYWRRDDNVPVQCGLGQTTPARQPYNLRRFPGRVRRYQGRKIALGASVFRPLLRFLVRLSVIRQQPMTELSQHLKATGKCCKRLQDTQFSAWRNRNPQHSCMAVLSSENWSKTQLIEQYRFLADGVFPFQAVHRFLLLVKSARRADYQIGFLRIFLGSARVFGFARRFLPSRFWVFSPLF